MIRSYQLLNNHSFYSAISHRSHLNQGIQTSLQIDIKADSKHSQQLVVQKARKLSNCLVLRLIWELTLHNLSHSVTKITKKRLQEWTLVQQKRNHPLMLKIKRCNHQRYHHLEWLQRQWIRNRMINNLTKNQKRDQFR